MTLPSTLLIGLPLVLVNLLSASASYRTLVHHYSLPLALVADRGLPSMEACKIPRQTPADRPGC